MKRINLLKKYTVVFIFMLMIGMPFFHTTPPVTVYASEIQPLSDDIRWVYKEVNGVYYKRLYNFTTRSWVGSWIRVPTS